MPLPQRIRVLILEDNPSDADLMVDALKQAGLDPEWERVESEADFASRLVPGLDLILSDYHLPQFNGIQALQIARSSAPEVPFIIVSGSIGEDIAVEAMRSGADDYLLKDRMARLGQAVLQALERKRLRDQMRRSESALAESGERLNAIIETTVEGIITIDEQGRVESMNPAAVNIFGYTLDELLGQDVNRLMPAPYANQQDIYLENYLRTGEDKIIGIGREVFGRRKNGSIFPIDLSVTEVHVGGKRKFAGFVRDITERKLQAQKIEKLSRVRAVSSEINSLIIRVRDRQELFDGTCRIAVEHGKFGVAVRERRAVYNNDIAVNAEVGGKRRQEAVRRGYHSAISLPLIVSGEIFGNLSLFVKEPGFFDAEEVSLLTELAGNLSFALEYMARQEKIDKLSRIRAVSGGINAAIVRIRERRALLEGTCRIASEQGKFEMVWVAEVDAGAQQAQAAAWAGFTEAEARGVTWAEIDAASGSMGEAIATRKAAVRNDIGEQLRSGTLRDVAVERGCGSTVCLPLTVDDKVVGVVNLFASGRNFFDEDELALLNAVAADVSFALQDIDRQQRLDYLAYYDTVTGLPNRTLFLDRVGQQVHGHSGEAPMVALILLNIDRFRYINETLGRHGGDELLKLLALRLECAFGGKDCLARIGADNFGVLIRYFRDLLGVTHALESQVFACFRNPFVVGAQELRVAASGGIALFPVDGADADTLFKNAEAALKKAKVSGERYLFYATDMNARAAHALSLETRLRKAVEAQEFVLHYQPKIDLKSGALCSLEALIRWQDPAAGLVAPGDFIPVLEETGLILEVGKWVIERALADYTAWKERYGAAPRIAVNVSAIQLQQRDFSDMVIEAVRRHGDIPEALELEVTESLVMRDVQTNIRKLAILRSQEIRIAMDDFGTGYSSLSYLARLPMDSLKIDRSFITQMTSGDQDMAIVTTIIALAHSLNLKVIAEGVETEEQAKMLTKLKCDEAQGYLYSKPLPAAEIESLLRAFARSTAAGPLRGVRQASSSH